MFAAHENIAQAKVICGIVRRQLNRPAEQTHRLVRPAQLLLQNAQEMMGLSMRRIGLNDL